MNYATLDDFLRDLPALAREHRQELEGRAALILLQTNQGRSVLVRLRDGEVTFPTSCGEEPECTIIAGEEDLMGIIAGKLNPAMALMFGKVKIKGNPKPLLELISLIK
ncbi:MAG: SCP2 sterol-binding domain-containing protein [Clostridiales bacterium]|nr:SCP2 sterol-binding domain-containing protein [Clostridiales bacterium]